MKIDDLKNKLAKAHSEFEGQYIQCEDRQVDLTSLTASCFRRGFSAALELELPVKFAEWLGIDAKNIYDHWIKYIYEDR